MSFTVSAEPAVGQLPRTRTRIPAGRRGMQRPPLPGSHHRRSNGTLTPTFGTPRAPDSSVSAGVRVGDPGRDRRTALADSLPDLAAVLDAAVMASLQYRTELVDAGSLAGRGAVGAGLSSLQAGNWLRRCRLSRTTRASRQAPPPRTRRCRRSRARRIKPDRALRRQRSATDDLARWPEGQPAAGPRSPVRPTSSPTGRANPRPSSPPAQNPTSKRPSSSPQRSSPSSCCWRWWYGCGGDRPGVTHGRVGLGCLRHLLRVVRGVVIGYAWTVVLFVTGGRYLGCCANARQGSEADYLWVFMVPALNEGVTIADSVERLRSVRPRARSSS